MFAAYAEYGCMIDVGIVTVFTLTLAVIGIIADRYNAKQQKKLRGATRC
jgi:hypothetical protein